MRFDGRSLSVLLGAAICVVAASLPSHIEFHRLTPKPTVDYNRDVRPILAQHCWVCHGADKAALAKTGNMSLDNFAGATADRGGYRAITPGSPEKSVLLAKVTSTDPDTQMPPTGSGVKPLSKDEIQILTTWIKEGAEYRAHWAFVPPKKPALPTVSIPGWAKNDIDRFIEAGLSEKGLKPEPEADRRTLARRLFLTLTGLPPTPQEVEAFVADKHPDAYVHLVDHLLASEHFGENQARYWLDAVRYADTHGLHIDNERSIFPYRDWVVRAYNEDLPYNQFALWQLAGDLLPSPTTEQKIATGYIRLNPTTNEGGAIEAEFLAKNTMDRVDTTSTVFMGVTLQCAKCHDHKYDPFTQRDYYSMYAFLDSTADTPLDGNLRLHEPVMKAPTPAQALQLDALDAKIRAFVSATKVEEAAKWALAQNVRFPTAHGWQVNGPYPGKTFDEAFDTDLKVTADGVEAQKPWRDIKFELEKPIAGVVNAENSSAYLRAIVEVDDATHIDLRVGSDDGVKVWVNGKLVHANKVFRAIGTEDLVPVYLRKGANSLVIKIVNGGGVDGASAAFGGPKTQLMAKIRNIAAGSPTGADADLLVRTYLQEGPASPTATTYRQLMATRKALDDSIPMTYVAKELPMPRPTFILRRGQYDLPGDKVDRAVPAVFGAIPANAPKNRLGLARWIIDPQNPLTARVMVNRIWQQHFGQGIVKTSEDFGSRGDWPSNPELLDYLASRFVQDGWSIKKLTRLIVTSAAYRQSATSTAAKRLKDPENVLISRGPRFRLDAEVIRDCALAESGLLVDKPGGHDDKPYQPPGLWEIIAYPISDTAKYMQDHGDSLYRRSLYLFWKRTSPPPVMMLLDAPMRESCVVRRSRTNTPTQALATLNETGFVEDARAMAERVLKTKKTQAERLDYAFRLATGRPAKPNELTVIQQFLDAQRARYKADPKDAEKTLAIGESKRDASIPATEHAAWTLTCNLILNLDESLTLH